MTVKTTRTKPVAAKAKSTATKPKTVSAAAAKPDFSAAALSAKVQQQAKAAIARGNGVLEDVKVLTKGNVDAVKSAGLILGTGLKGMGTEFVAEGREAIETVKADFQGFAAIKTPADLIQLQSKLASRNIKAAFAFGSKTSESLVQLARTAGAPLATRMGVVADAVRKAA